MENKKLQAHSAIFLANTIFGLGVPVTKLLLDEWVTPMGYMASRSLGACLVFWLIAAFMPKRGEGEGKGCSGGGARKSIKTVQYQCS